MRLKASDKLQAIMFIGKMEHDEERILYQFIIGSMVSFSVALVVGIVQGYITLLNGFYYLLGFWEFAILVAFLTKRRLINLRNRLVLEIKELGGK
ncbi:MAG: hypothetical protein J4473_01420 [Candidatus Aenigmarchaeota archaeon]|nr:hypothetical protein [Candidatus Aenigmarchaeota archaeon]